jgi:hypothetical protein
LNLSAISRQFVKKAENPEIKMEVGELDGKFYLIDWATKRIQRLTLGAFVYLREHWNMPNRFAV